MVEQDSEDLMNMIQPKRQKMLAGAQITVWIGDEAVRGIAKRAAMAASSTLNAHFKENPLSLEYRFPENHLSCEAVKHLLVDWMNSTCKPFEAFPVQLNNDWRKDIAILRASRFLGMEHYTKDILTYWVRYFSWYLPHYEEISVVEKNATSEKDPLWTNMVNNLAHRRHKAIIPDTLQFTEFVREHPRLSKALDDADAHFGCQRMERQAKLDAERQKREAELQAAWLQRGMEKEQERRKAAQIAESLRKKMNTDRNVSKAVQFVTPEQAALLRGH
ncbi:hypothetical protein BCR34DRAFT_495336 [Clohesyomyces aquaticus]|uniref:BTB domain-containing protein n=1 Tax=Clohesyomyces aquaticus TaxID=1231657 RepID=A0A1Y1YN93_9PLEO|nr:hypothetical protein BCR34DRAFT_495336 [Clohesyomyces aquaticus]